MMTAASQGHCLLQWNLLIRKRTSATQGTPPGKDELKWVANTVTLIYGEHDAVLVDTFLSEAQTKELADWIASTGKRLSTIYITHAHADHFFGLKLLRDRFSSGPRDRPPAGGGRHAGRAHPGSRRKLAPAISRRDRRHIGSGGKAGWHGVRSGRP
jgi:glyoxylase-like metal-dependent hydrolase (beta-lactamase superfamily II)